MKYNVTIEETIVQEYEIEADSIDDARCEFIDKYRDGEYLLENAECQESKIKITDEFNIEETDWEII